MREEGLVFRQLIDDLRARGPLARGQSDLCHLLGVNAREWPGRETLLSQPGHYTRTRVYRDANFELLLLNWAAGAASAIHDHGGQHCWIQEFQVYDPPARRCDRAYGIYDAVVLDDRMIVRSPQLTNALYVT